MPNVSYKPRIHPALLSLYWENLHCRCHSQHPPLLLSLAAEYKQSDMVMVSVSVTANSMDAWLQCIQETARLRMYQCNAWFPPFCCRSAVLPFPLLKFRKNYISAVRITLLTRKIPLCCCRCHLLLRRNRRSNRIE